MTLTEVRQGIEAALTTAGVTVGAYKLQDNTSIPAYRVGDQTPPGVIGVTGLEVVLRPTPRIKPRPQFGSGVVLDQTWRVVLKRWNEDSISPEGLTKATKAIIKRFQVIETPIIQDAGSDTIEQVFIAIPDFDAI
jgi:hypothetical protein